MSRSQNRSLPKIIDPLSAPPTNSKDSVITFMRRLKGGKTPKITGASLARGYVNYLLALGAIDSDFQRSKFNKWLVNSQSQNPVLKIAFGSRIQPGKLRMLLSKPPEQFAKLASTRSRRKIITASQNVDNVTRAVLQQLERGDVYMNSVYEYDRDTWDDLARKFQ